MKNNSFPNRPERVPHHVARQYNKINQARRDYKGMRGERLRPSEEDDLDLPVADNDAREGWYNPYASRRPRDGDAYGPYAAEYNQAEYGDSWELDSGNRLYPDTEFPENIYDGLYEIEQAPEQKSKKEARDEALLQLREHGVRGSFEFNRFRPDPISVVEEAESLFHDVEEHSKEPISEGHKSGIYKAVARRLERGMIGRTVHTMALPLLSAFEDRDHGITISWMTEKLTEQVYKYLAKNGFDLSEAAMNQYAQKTITDFFAELEHQKNKLKSPVADRIPAAPVQPNVAPENRPKRNMSSQFQVETAPKGETTIQDNQEQPDVAEPVLEEEVGPLTRSERAIVNLRDNLVQQGSTMVAIDKAIEWFEQADSTIVDTTPEHPGVRSTLIWLRGLQSGTNGPKVPSMQGTSILAALERNYQGNAFEKQDVLLTQMDEQEAETAEVQPQENEPKKPEQPEQETEAQETLPPSKQVFSDVVAAVEAKQGPMVSIESARGLIDTALAAVENGSSEQEALKKANQSLSLLEKARPGISTSKYITRESLLRVLQERYDAARAKMSKSDSKAQVA